MYIPLRIYEIQGNGEIIKQNTAYCNLHCHKKTIARLKLHFLNVLTTVFVWSFM